GRGRLHRNPPNRRHPRVRSPRFSQARTAGSIRLPSTLTKRRSRNRHSVQAFMVSARTALREGERRGALLADEPDLVPSAARGWGNYTVEYEEEVLAFLVLPWPLPLGEPRRSTFCGTCTEFEGVTVEVIDAQRCSAL